MTFYSQFYQNNSNSSNKWIIKLLFLGGADSNKGKSKKWKKILQFPHITQCIDMKDKLGMFYVFIDNTIQCNVLNRCVVQCSYIIELFNLNLCHWPMLNYLWENLILSFGKINVLSQYLTIEIFFIYLMQNLFYLC